MALHLPDDQALSHPAALATSLREPGVSWECAPAMRRFEGHHIPNGEPLQSSPQAAVFPVERICDYGPKQPLLVNCLLDQLQSDLALGAKGRIAPPLWEIRLRGRGLDLQWGIDLGVCPQAGDRHRSIVNLAHTAQIVASYMRGFVAVLPISCLINDEHALSREEPLLSLYAGA